MKCEKPAPHCVQVATNCGDGYSVCACARVYVDQFQHHPRPFRAAIRSTMVIDDISVRFVFGVYSLRKSWAPSNAQWRFYFNFASLF